MSVFICVSVCCLSVYSLSVVYRHAYLFFYLFVDKRFMFLRLYTCVYLCLFEVAEIHRNSSLDLLVHVSLLLGLFVNPLPQSLHGLLKGFVFGIHLDEFGHILSGIFNFFQGLFGLHLTEEGLGIVGAKGERIHGISQRTWKGRRRRRDKMRGKGGGEGEKTWKGRR